MFVFIEIPLKAETFPNEFIWQTFNISSKCHWSALNHILFSLSITLSILSLTQQVSVLHQNLFAFQEGNMSLERFSSTWSPALWILCGLECMDSFSDLTISFSVRILFSLKLFRLLWGVIFYSNYLQATTCIIFYLFIPLNCCKSPKLKCEEKCVVVLEEMKIIFFIFLSDAVSQNINSHYDRCFFFGCYFGEFSITLGK